MQIGSEPLLNTKNAQKNHKTQGLAVFLVPYFTRVIF